MSSARPIISAPPPKKTTDDIAAVRLIKRDANPISPIPNAVAIIPVVFNALLY